VPSTAHRSGVEAVIAGWQNPGRQASAHYLVDRDGTITQMVREADVAFHTPGNNVDSIGIEHADVCNDPAPLTTRLYERSAALVRDLATRHGFAINNTTVAGHSQVNANHGDPGPYWDWEYFFLLLAWAGIAAASRPIRLVTAAATRPAAPAGWQVRRRRVIPNDHCGSRRDPWGATYWRAQPSATGAVAELSMVVEEACTYKVSLWWPDVAGANPSVPVDIEVACLTLARSPDLVSAIASCDGSAIMALLDRQKAALRAALNESIAEWDARLP
jgi:N-acetylmuramoyl-L-alanine amidase